MRVLLTRQPAQAGDLEAGLVGAEAAGERVRVGFLPLTDFALPEDVAPLRALLAEWERRGGWLVVTSPNTVRALRGVGWDGHVRAGCRIAVTGPGTARVLREAGVEAAPWTPPEDRSAEGLIAGLTALHPGGARAWLPQSDRARPRLAEGLRAAGWEVRTALAYRTVPYPAPAARRLLAGEAESDAGPETAAASADVVTPAVLASEPEGVVVLLTSSSAAEEFAADGLAPLAGAGTGEVRPARVRLVAIGEPTRQTCDRLGLPLAGTAATPDAPGVLAVLRGLRRSPDRRPDRDRGLDQGSGPERGPGA
ncbi:uroporphyrinogen-III synthase [Micrococcus endophyticus]|uniref:uroporphyrinogen-III synthase n=1 Tax=Micrococcus endophyticus TaxID=455343 RepID=UPI0034CE4187